MLPRFFSRSIKTSQGTLYCLNVTGLAVLIIKKKQTFDVDEVTQRKYSDHEGDVTIVSKHAYIAILPIEHSLSWLCHWSPGVPYHCLHGNKWIKDYHAISIEMNWTHKKTSRPMLKIVWVTRKNHQPPSRLLGEKLRSEMCNRQQMIHPIHTTKST